MKDWPILLFSATIMPLVLVLFQFFFPFEPLTMVALLAYAGTLLAAGIAATLVGSAFGLAKRRHE